jgi:hypothetical protein
MTSGRSAIPGDPFRGLEPTAKEIGRNLEQVGVADVPLPGLDHHIERRRAMTGAHALVRRLVRRTGWHLDTQLGTDDIGDYLLIVRR